MPIRKLSKSNIWLVASLTAIAAVTISPFDFAIPADFSYEYIRHEFKFGSSLKDYWQNILLFLPWGISLASVIFRQQLATRWNVVAIVSVASILLSTTIETTQLLLPSRVANLSDILCNSLGGFLGTIIYFKFSQIVYLLGGIITQNRQMLSAKSLLWAIASYCTFVTLLIVALLANINLSNWNDNVYLTIGNETTGNRPWRGKISNLYISDRGLNRQEVEKVFQQPDVFFARSPNLVTFLQFTKEDYHRDLSLHLPPLVWKSQTSDLSANNHISEQNGLKIDSRQWLQTATVAASLNHRLKQTSELSLYLTIASNKVRQFGPARIVTLSDGLYGQNLMLAQEGKDLSLRLRTPITGNSATQPEFIVPGVFENVGVCHILVTFARRKLSIYLNSARHKYSFKFTPATSFISYLPLGIERWIVDLTTFSIQKYQLAFLISTVTPLSILAVVLLRYLQPLI